MIENPLVFTYISLFLSGLQALLLLAGCILVFRRYSQKHSPALLLLGLGLGLWVVQSIGQMVVPLVFGGLGSTIPGMLNNSVTVLLLNNAFFGLAAALAVVLIMTGIWKLRKQPN